jgi:CHAT domain-containing protein/Tfp pilus assembly protein PilF
MMRGLLRLLLLAAAFCGVLGLATAQAPPGPSPAARELSARLIDASEADWREFLAANPQRIDMDLRRGLTDTAIRLATGGRFADALRGYDRARQIADQIGDRRGTAAALTGMGSMLSRRGDSTEAARFLSEGLAISESINDGPNIEVALNNLGIVRRSQGEYEEALQYYRRALTLAQQLGRAAPVARTLNNIANVHLLRGNYLEALEVYRQSLRLKEETKQPDIAVTLANIGNVYERMGDFELALEYFRQSMAAIGTTANSPAAYDTLIDIGRVYAELRRFDEALDYDERALSLYEAAGLKPQIAATLQSFGGVHRSRGDLDGAMGYYRRSLAIRERINDRLGLADTLVDMATVLGGQGDWSAALDTARRAARLAGEVGSRETFWLARVAEGEAHEALGRPAAAVDAYREAADIIDELRGSVVVGEQERQRFLEGRLKPFHNLARVLLADGRIADALGAAERAKARVMLDVLRAGRADVGLLRLDERERDRQLARATSAAHARLQAEAAKETPDAGALAGLRDAFGTARAAEAEFRAALYAAHPALKLSRGDAGLGSPRDLGAIVGDARTAVLEFMVAPDATYLIVASRDEARGGIAGELRLRSFTIPIGDETLSREVERFRRQLAARDLDIQQTARDLYQRLLAPADSELRGKTNLIIVPDGPLWGLPFQALSPGPKQYLIERAAISVAPSIAVLREVRATRAGVRPAPTLLAFGDSLPETTRQVRRLEQVYGTRHSQVFVGRDASEDRFVSASHTSTVLHIAAHGEFDDASPMYSHLVLAGDAAAEAPRNGRLEAWEIMKLNLHADVTVLAACETARGRIGGGEGVIGLSWAFFLAGSPRTVVSLWKVDAASTTDLMLAFHRRVRASLSRQQGRPEAAASLRSAALSLLGDPQYRHPFYWAGFVVMGDGS